MDLNWTTPLTVIGGIAVAGVLLPVLFLLLLPILLPFFLLQAFLGT
jgi:hypothetical protein